MRNAATLIDPPRVSARELRPFTPEDARAFLKAIDGHSLEAFFTVALAYGLRLGEGLGLQWTDVDLDKGTLRVRQALQRFGGDAPARRPVLAERKRLLKSLREARDAEQPDQNAFASLTEQLAKVRVSLREVKTAVQLVEPKSARSRRTISLPSIAVKALNRHRVRQLEARLAAGKRWQDSGLVFTTPKGTPLDARNITRDFKAILTVNKLPGIRIHDLRHSGATLLLAQGVNPRVVMETLGHSQVSLTLNTYSHRHAEDQNDDGDEEEKCGNRKRPDHGRMQLSAPLSFLRFFITFCGRLRAWSIAASTSSTVSGASDGLVL